MNRNDDLQDCLRALAKAAPQEAGPVVQQNLLVHFRQRRTSKRRRIYISAMAASVALAIGLYLAPWRPHPAIQRVPTAMDDQTSGFITLPYAQSEVPLEQPVIVRVDIPVSELGMMGVPFSATDASERVRADLLVGQDGVTRAVRFVK
jgi:hypothetical protein